MRTMVLVDGEEYLAVEEAAGLLGVKRETLYAYVSRGLLKSYRQGIKRQRLYRRSEIDALLRLAPSSAEDPAGDIPRQPLRADKDEHAEEEQGDEGEAQPLEKKSPHRSPYSVSRRGRSPGG